MNILHLIVISLLCLLPGLASKMTIVSPSKLADEFSQEDIGFSVSNFGNTPYGAHFVGKLFLSDPLDACGELERFMEGENTLHDNVIALARRGNCRVSIKARNAQWAGAKALLLINDDDKELDEWFGHEQGADDIKIPTLMVKNGDGEKLLNYLTHNNPSSGESEESNSIILSIVFPFERRSNKVHLDFWYSSADTVKSSYMFLDRFYDYWSKNKDFITFTPHFVTWGCVDCKKADYKNPDEDCLSGGRYCAPDPDDSGKATGADVVWEDLRQACIYNISQQLWWDYVREYPKCLKSEDLRNCGDNLLNGKATVGQPAKVQACIALSFVVDKSEGRQMDPKLDDNKILKEDKNEQLEYAIHQFPALFINHKPYYGKLHHAQVVFEETCRNLDTLTTNCNLALARTGENTSEVKQSHALRIIILVILMTVLAVLIFYCCKRMIKSDREMSTEVGGLVTRYFALRDTNEQTTNKEEES